MNEQRFREIALQLLTEEAAPDWFCHIPHVYRRGGYKDLRKIPDTSARDSLIFNDIEDVIHPVQRDMWIPVLPFEPPCPSHGRELERVLILFSRGNFGRQNGDVREVFRQNVHADR